MDVLVGEHVIDVRQPTFGKSGRSNRVQTHFEGDADRGINLGQV